MSIAGKTRLSAILRSSLSSALPVPLNSSKITVSPVDPVSTIADGIVWLSQNVHRNSMVRKIQALKMRGQATQPGLHTMRITNDGVSVFPRMLSPVDEAASLEPMRFISSGIPGLDVVVLDAGHGCCGAAGTNMLADPARAATLRDPLLQQLEASGATRLLSANIGCRLHLANGTTIPVQHPLDHARPVLRDEREADVPGIGLLAVGGHVCTERRGEAESQNDFHGNLLW